MNVAQLALAPVTQTDVEIAWMTYRALVLAEVDDRTLLNDEAHQQAQSLAYERYSRLFDEWCRR
jgi:hypothetical protein